MSATPTAPRGTLALAWLVVALKHAGVTLLDCQFITGHLASLGAVEISQKQYLDLLRQAQDQRGASWSSLPEGFSAVLAAAGAAGGFAGAGAAAAAGAVTGEASSPGKFIAQSLTHTS